MNIIYITVVIFIRSDMIFQFMYDVSDIESMRKSIIRSQFQV